MSNSEANDDGQLSLSESLVSFSDQRVPILHSFTISGPIFTGGLPGVIDRTSSVSRPRASEVSIEAMPTVTVASEEGNECSICLDGLKVGDEAKEMPCKHRFHRACIKKWMGMSTLCPLCRFSLPAESEEEENSDDGDDHFSLFRSILDVVNNGSDTEDDSESEEDIGGEWESSTVDDDDASVGDNVTFRFNFSIE
ncbi:putative aminoacyltransferase, E1 ubiquitin-activating enzyme [Rosa chinensis]|uniref:Putative aminoacyltransferase, E1 ubiquitin-activating enzyme n=1 Tax=Rosa chinensis TaxID=74649 RepID=A0A2P6QPP6_ROSCH|nr:E3 ubiquitin-protein ligase MPSR1 [Rosa chinensis]PRQ36137.1 putative aminoacyltransferase, E1 ubiquitin-activating enzyme [Rosa chinensis]